MKPLNKEKIILASGSPRRKELMETAGLDFDIIPADIDESALPFKGDPGAYARQLSLKKAQAVAVDHPHTWTIGADTIVVVDDQLLGKPENKDDALAMLQRLSGESHSVYTGFSIVHPADETLFSRAVETKVRFKYLSQEEIIWYANTKEPYDKAGAYGIQGIGAFIVKQIKGSYTNVVGLPVCELIQALAGFGVIRF